MTLGATVSYREGVQSGEIPAAGLFVGPMVTTLPMAAVLTGVRFPVWRERVGVGFQEISSRRSDFAFASAAGAGGTRSGRHLRAHRDRGRRRDRNAAAARQPPNRR